MWSLRFWKLITVKEEIIDSKSDFQDTQIYAAFNNDDEVIIEESSLSSRFNYQKEI